MTIIEWEEEYSVGIPAVDHEHKELIKLINETYEKMLRRQDADEGVEEFLGEIYAKISAHFALEEHVMQEKHYDHFEDHKADHERLLDDIRDIMDEYESRRHFSREELAERLRTWFSDHFKTRDARLHGHLD